MEQKLKEYLLNNTDTLYDIVRQINSWDNSLDWLDYFENDEWFLNDMFQSTADAVRAVCYGKYNYTDDYVKFNAYGNLESCNDLELEHELQDSIDEIIDRLIELKDEIDIYDDELKEILGDE